jgi:hypothetical protein
MMTTMMLIMTCMGWVDRAHKAGHSSLLVLWGSHARFFWDQLARKWSSRSGAATLVSLGLAPFCSRRGTNMHLECLL